MNILPAFSIFNSAASARNSAAALCLAVMLGAGSQARAEPASTDAVIAVVNGNQILESDLQVADEVIGRNLLVRDPVERRDSLLNMMIDMTLLAQAAKDQKTENDADLQRRINFARNQGLATYLLAVVGEKAVSEEAMRKAYDEVVVKGTKPETEYHLRHLVFMIAPPKDEAAVKEAEDKARAAMARVNKGEDFAAVVADVSEDPVTKARGGDYDWRQPGEMPKEYSDLAAELKKGEVSQPFKTAVGWHILKLEDSRPRKIADYDKIRERLAAMVANAAQMELIDKVRATAKIERKDQIKKTEKSDTSVR